MQPWTVAAAAAIALLLAGCSKQPDESPGSRGEQEAKASQPARQPAAPAAGTDDEAADTAAAAAQAARAMGTSAEEAPEYIKKLFVHIKEITRLTRENMNDCVKAAEIVGAYVEKHQEEMDVLSKQAREAAKNMSDAEKLKYGMQVQALFASEMKDIFRVQMQFASKCSEQAKVIGSALSKLKMK